MCGACTALDQHCEGYGQLSNEIITALQSLDVSHTALTHMYTTLTQTYQEHIAECQQHQQEFKTSIAKIETSITGLDKRSQETSNSVVKVIGHLQMEKHLSTLASASLYEVTRANRSH